MRRVLLPAFTIMLMAAAAAAQTAVSAAPRVLSTVPSPPDGATPVPAQMSGLPLQVGDLPPGVVVVRVIRGSFQNNVTNQAVQLRVGSGSRVLAAATSADGRAQFDGLAVGDVVRVRTTLDGELLESQSFTIPSQGGVRLVLVAGTGAGVTAAEPWPEASGRSSAAAAAPILPPPPNRRAADAASTPTLTYVVLGATAGAVIGVVVFWPSVRRRMSSAAAPTARRSDVFEQLVQLEKDCKAGRLASDLSAIRREALIEELLSFD